jgi:F-type H+-transporting ATPase subunit delta
MAAFVSRYASAFLDVVTSAKLNTAEIEGQLSDFLGTWQGSPELREFFVNPSIPALQKVKILDKLNERLKLQKELRNLLAVLIDNNRIGAVSEVAQAYRKLLQEQLGIRQAEVVTARELSPAERTSLLAEIGKLAGARIDAKWLRSRQTRLHSFFASKLRITTRRCASTRWDCHYPRRWDRTPAWAGQGHGGRVAGIPARYRWFGNEPRRGSGGLGAAGRLHRGSRRRPGEAHRENPERTRGRRDDWPRGELAWPAD